MMEMFQTNGCQSLVDILFLPLNSAIRTSPLDNTLIHEWKEKCRKRSPITKKNIEQVMNDEWSNIETSHIKHYYRHCAYSRQTDPIS